MDVFEKGQTRRLQKLLYSFWPVQSIMFETILPLNLDGGRRGYAMVNEDKTTSICINSSTGVYGTTF